MSHCWCCGDAESHSRSIGAGHLWANGKIEISLPCKWLAVAVVSEYEKKPVPRCHLVLPYRTCRQLGIVFWESLHLRAQVFNIVRVDEENIRYILITSSKIRNTSELLRRQGVDKIRTLVGEINAI